MMLRRRQTRSAHAWRWNISVIYVCVLTIVLTFDLFINRLKGNGEGGIRTLGVIPLFVVLTFSQQFSRIVVYFGLMLIAEYQTERSPEMAARTGFRRLSNPSFAESNVFYAR
jgi:hypothetical protein